MSARRAAVPAVVALATLLAPATAAAAAEPERTGWWNRLSAGSVVLPQPTTQPGDLRVASGPDRVPTAYAGVLYSAPGSSAATLDLAVRSTSGTPEVVACPTATTDWSEGGNQPYEKAPGYDCDAGLAFGSLSADGKTLSFVLDTTTQIEPGVWSLALVPAPEATGLFSVDVVAPEAGAFQAEAPASTTEPSTGTSSDGSVDSGASGTGSGEAFLPGGFEAPADLDTGSTELPPLVAGEAAPAPATAPEPAVAGGAAPAAAPLLLARPAAIGEDLGAGRRLLALLVLAGGSAAVGYAAGQQRPGPRLIGGRSRLAVPAAGPAVPAAPPSAEDRPRGIGRFAKTRDAAPRRLR